MKVLIYDQPYILINNLLIFWLNYATECIEQKGRFTVALSGGKTPVELYTRLSAIDKFDIWKNTYVFLADERAVPDEHPDSNLRSLKEHLLDFVPIPEKNIYPIPTNTGSAETSALYYEGLLEEFFELPVGAKPHFDLVLLGIGEDGHTASLFPRDINLEEKDRLVISARPENVKHERISLSLPVINQAHKIIFLVTGKNKSTVVEGVFSRDPLLPASKVDPASGELLLFTDAAAARLLPKENGRNEGEALIIE
jgi:6-phosphogluconolactonase